MRRFLSGKRNGKLEDRRLSVSKTTYDLKASIQAEPGNLINNLTEKILNTEQFDVDQLKRQNPLYNALIPHEILKTSHLERQFETLIGGVWESLAVVVAQHYLGFAQKHKRISGVIKQERLHRITETLNQLEFDQTDGNRVQPNWDRELEYILEGAGEEIPTQVICDLYVENTSNDSNYAFELKEPLPNSDQTKVSKEKILKLYAMEPRQIAHAFFALPYNPYGQRENYEWSVPARWFNMKEDRVVLIGDEFWDKVGGPGTFQVIIEIASEVGQGYKERIYREYLGIEPPTE